MASLKQALTRYRIASFILVIGDFLPLFVHNLAILDMVLLIFFDELEIVVPAKEIHHIAIEEFGSEYRTHVFILV